MGLEIRDRLTAALYGCTATAQNGVQGQNPSLHWAVPRYRRYREAARGVAGRSANSTDPRPGAPGRLPVLLSTVRLRGTHLTSLWPHDLSCL